MGVLAVQIAEADTGHYGQGQTGYRRVFVDQIVELANARLPRWFGRLKTDVVSEAQLRDGFQKLGRKAVISRVGADGAENFGWEESDVDESVAMAIEVE